MIWYNHMFIGKLCRKNSRRLQYQISNRLSHPGIYLITLSENPHALLEMIPSVLLLQPCYPVADLRIVGMASTKIEALKLVTEMIEEIYKQQGGFENLTEYFEQYK